MQMQAKLCKRDGGGGDEDSNSGGLSLPEDIIFELLLRLPARALCRFRRVCKAWRALISAPAFVAAQRSRAGPLMAAVFGSTTTERRQEVRLLDMGGNVLRVFDIRGGTALLAPTRIDLIFVDRAELGAMIIDPASGRDFTVVGTNENDPPPPWWPPTLTLTDVSSDYSFGRAAASGDYKVLSLLASKSYRHVRSKWCEVATVMDGGAVSTWRRRPWGPFFSCKGKATVNGVLYFLPYNPYTVSHAENHIAAFDLDTEEWRPETTKCPPLERKEEDAWNIALTELKGTLCAVQSIRHHASWDGHYVNLWLLMDPNKSIWVKEYGIHMPAGFLMSTKPLDALGDGTILLLNVSKKAGNFMRYFLQFYNSRTEDFTDIVEMAHGFNGIMAFYTGSLLS